MKLYTVDVCNRPMSSAEYFASEANKEISTFDGGILSFVFVLTLYEFQ